MDSKRREQREVPPLATRRTEFRKHAVVTPLSRIANSLVGLTVTQDVSTGTLEGIALVDADGLQQLQQQIGIEG